MKQLFTTLVLLSALHLNSLAQDTYVIFSENQLCGLKNQQGQIVIPAKYISISNPADKDNGKITDYKGLFTAKQTGKDGAIKGGIINTKGETILPFNYRYVTPFSDDLAIAVTDKQLDIVDISGKIVNTIKYSAKEAVVKGFNHGIGVAYGFYNSGKITVFNKEKIISTFKTKTNFDLKILSPELITLRDGYKGYNQYYGLYNINGQRVSEEMFFHISPPNQQGFIQASTGWDRSAKYGFIDGNGKVVVPLVHGQDLSNMNKNGIFSSAGSLYNSKNEIIKKANKDTAYYVLSNSEYFVYGNPYFYHHYNKKDAHNIVFRGIMDDKLNVITPEIFYNRYLRSLNDNTFVYRINKKTFTIAANGKISPDNGSLEYENAMAAMPTNATHELDWKLPNTYLKLSAAKNYAPAQKTLDSLYNDANYVKLNPNNKEIHNVDLEKNALAGNANSMHLLGTAYLKGSSKYPQNTEKGVQWLQQAVNKNHAEAAYELVYHYIRQHDENKAQQVLNNYKGEKPYKMQDLYAPGGLQLALAKFSAHNEQLQAEFYTKAINMGNTEAARNYGRKLIYSKNTDEIAKGLNILHNNIAKGDVNSMMTLGDYYSIYASNKSRVDRTKSNNYYNMVMASNKASIYDKQEAKTGLFENNKPEPLAVGTILNIDNQKKAIVFRDAYGFRTHDNKYYVSANSNYNDYKNYNIIKGASGTKACNSCNGTGKTNKQVVDGSYTTKDITYKTGSTVSGDYKVTTTKTHNTYKSVQEKCLVCNGHGIVFSK